MQAVYTKYGLYRICGQSMLLGPRHMNQRSHSTPGSLQSKKDRLKRHVGEGGKRAIADDDDESCAEENEDRDKKSNGDKEVCWV
jgi:hypothetical protein